MHYHVSATENYLIREYNFKDKDYSELLHVPAFLALKGEHSATNKRYLTSKYNINAIYYKPI